MAVDKPVPVPKAKISSVDVPNFGAGLFRNGAQDAPINSFINNKNTELDIYGFIIPRRTLSKFLPDTVETTYQKFPVLWNGEIFYFTADDGKIKFCQAGDNDWTDCATPGVAAVLTTALTGANNDLKFTALELGPDGNNITVAYINAGASKPLVVSVVGSAISVQLATNGSSTITSTGSTVLAAIIASTAASALVSAALAPANTGAGLVTVLTATHLAGGSGTNLITTNNGGMPIFLRVLNVVMCLNGTNGDKLCYVDLSDPSFPVVKYDLVADPVAAPTDALTNLTAGALSIYYAYSFNGAVGETLLSPILTESINIDRDQWQDDTALPGSIEITRTDSPPPGALSWNLYVAPAATGGSITTTDMLQLATGLDLANDTFVDNGSLSINLSSVAPQDNSTDGPRVDHGIVEDGSPILYGDVDNPYNIWIGGPGPNALYFSVSNGGYLAQPEQGSNFYPNAIVGFRNGQGIPSLTVLYSNTEGLSKQAVLEQQTVNYGDQSFTVWGVTEQHYGAAGVAAPNSLINYNGKLMFFSTDGPMTMQTQPTVQNVLSTASSAKAVDDLVRSVKNSAMKTVVGTGWNNKFMWLVATGGFDTPQQILILDTNNKGVDGNGAWYTMDIAAQWIGVISPQSDSAFVYLAQGRSTYKLLTGNSTYDSIGGVSVPFATGSTGALIGMGGDAHNEWQANVQVMFYIVGLIGDMTIGVNYRNQNGKIKTKTKLIQGPVFTPSGSGGWGDPGWGYSTGPTYSSEPVIDDTIGVVTAIDVRKAIQIDDIFNEGQWFFQTSTGYNNFKFRAVSFEGINLGVRPDLQ